LQYLLKHKWDLCLVTLAPLFIVVLFSSMFAQGKPEHLPIAIIDQDRSNLSRSIEHHLALSSAVKIALISDSQTEVEQQLNQNKIWGYVHIPAGAEQRLVQAKDAEISIAYNQSYFSVGNTISSAMLLGTLQAMADFMGQNYLESTIPYLDVPTPNVKVSPLYNPGLNYEFYLEPYMIPAILHLLLCCCVAFSVGQELKFKTAQQLDVAVDDLADWHPRLVCCRTFVADSARSDFTVQRLCLYQQRNCAGHKKSVENLWRDCRLRRFIAQLCRRDPAPQ